MPRRLNKEQKETLDAGGIKITLVNLTGTFNDSTAPRAPSITRPDYRMLGAIFQIPGEDGLHFVKCYGPKKTITDRADEIKAFLTSLKAGTQTVPGTQKVPGTVSESESSTPIHRFAPGFPVNTIAFSPDGKLIAAANDQQTVKLINVTTGKTFASLQIVAKEEAALLAYPAGAAAFQVSILAFSPDGNTLAVGTNLGQVKLFDVQSGKLLRSLDDAKARLAEKETPDKSTPIKRAMGSIESLAFSPDGKTLATSGNSFRDYADDAKLGRGSVRRSPGPGRLKLWDVGTGTVKEDLVAMVFPYGVTFSPDGHWLAQAGGWFVSDENWGNGAVLWNLEASKPAARFVKAIQDGGIYAVAFSPDSKLLAIGTNDEFHDKDGTRVGGRVSLFHIAKGVMEWSATARTPAKQVVFAHDGKCVVVLCDRHSIKFLDSEGGTLKREIRPAGFAQWAPFAIALNADLLAVGGVDANWNGLVEIWNCKTEKLPGTISSVPAAKPSFEARLLSGVTVELLGISENPSKDMPWWRPDGSPLRERPYDDLGNAWIPWRKDLTAREIAVRVGNLPPAPVGIATQWRLDPSLPESPRAGRYGRPTRAGVSVTGIDGVCFIIPRTKMTMSLRFGVAAGPWLSSSERDMDPLAEVKHEGVFSQPIEKPNGDVVIHLACKKIE